MATDGSDIPVKLTTAQTEEEEHTISLVKQYMALAYSPTLNTGRDCISHLCHADAEFVAPTTFPGCETPLDYADSHSKVMASLKDLHIKSIDILFAKGGHVLLRYSATGSHCGEPHNGIEATGKRAHWTASAIFEVQEGRIRRFVKEWDKLSMWKQLGWMKGDEYA